MQIVNITNPASPSLYGSFNLGSSGEGVCVSGNYAYVANNNNASELNILLGGSGAGYVTSGTFESASFDAGSTVAFNYLSFSATTPVGTSVTLQVAINNDNTTWNYFGSYTTSGQIPLGSINGRYIRYKATLTGTGTNTPALNDVSINYSP
jgi:hypothetical protein